MPAVTVPRTDLTAEEVSQVLHDGLGDGYNVLPGMVMGRPAGDLLMNTFGIARQVRQVLASAPSLGAR